MAEVKITSLTEATSADGAIIIPVVQGGITKRITLSNLLFTNSIGAEQISENAVGPSEASGALASELSQTVAASITPSRIGAATTAAAAAAQAQANSANALASSKVKTFSQPTTPVATTIGDLWVDTATTQLYRSTSTGTSGWVTQDIIAAESITSDKIAANSITAAQIAGGTITANGIAANNITSTQIAANSITSTHIAGGTITSDQIAANSITSTQIAGGTITANEIATNTITAAQIDGGTITANEIATNTITANEIVANTITTDQIAANTITANEIVANSITSDQIAANTITADTLQANSVTAHQVAAGGVTAIHIANNSISTGAVISNSITSASISSNNLSLKGTLNGDFDGSITGPDGSGDYTFNLGTKGFILHAPSGTAVMNTLVARNNIVTGNMISYDEGLGGLTTDTNGKIKIDVDDDTLKIAGGKLEIGTVPSSAVVNAYQDINWTGFSAGIENTPIRPDGEIGGVSGGVMFFTQSDNTHLTISDPDNGNATGGDGTVEGFEVGDICVITKNTSGSNHDPLNFVVRLTSQIFFKVQGSTTGTGYVPKGVRFYWAPAQPSEVKSAIPSGTITTSSGHSINFNEGMHGEQSVATTDGTYGIINTKTVSGAHPELYKYQGVDASATGNRATNNFGTAHVPSLITLGSDPQDAIFLLGKISADDHTDAATNISRVILNNLPFEIDLVGRCKIKVADKTGFVIGESISGSSSLFPARGTITDTFTITEAHSTGTVTTNFIEYEQVGATVFTASDTVTGSTSSSSTTVANNNNAGFTGGIIGKDGITNIAKFGSQINNGETKISLTLRAVWSSTDNLTGDDLSGKSQNRSKTSSDLGYGTVNPLMPNTKFTHTVSNFSIAGPDNDTQKYLYVWVGTQAGNLSVSNSHPSNKIFDINEYIRFGLKSSNDSWISMSTTGTLTNTSNAWSSLLDPNSDHRNFSGS
tara:strand:+ start:134 stop:2968 length:2835 start_codon:yes stop_codon:yes gene_type:complete